MTLHATKPYPSPVAAMAAFYAAKDRFLNDKGIAYTKADVPKGTAVTILFEDEKKKRSIFTFTYL